MWESRVRAMTASCSRHPMSVHLGRGLVADIRVGDHRPFLVLQWYPICNRSRRGLLRSCSPGARPKRHSRRCLPSDGQSVHSPRSIRRGSWIGRSSAGPPRPDSSAPNRRTSEGRWAIAASRSWPSTLSTPSTRRLDPAAFSRSSAHRDRFGRSSTCGRASIWRPQRSWRRPPCSHWPASGHQGWRAIRRSQVL